MYVTLNIETTN